MGVGELNVGVTARTGNARKNINAFRKDVRGVKGATGIASSGVAGLAMTLAKLAPIAIATRLALKGISEVDALAKTSDKLGITTSRLAGLRLAAEDTGVPIRTLDMGLQRMVRRISEAGVGLGEAKGALKELGINVDDLAAKSPDQQFADIAEAMAKVPSQADKVRLSFKLFDSEGVALVNTLKLGKSGLDEVQASARRLGIAISRDAAAKAEVATQAMGRMKSAASGLTAELGIFLAPAIGLVAQTATVGLRAVRTLGGVLGETTAKSDAAAESASKKTAADNRAAAAANARAKAEAGLTAEFEKQIAAARRATLDARLGEGTAENRENQGKFGAVRAEQLQGQRELAESAKEEIDRNKRLLEIKQRIADVNKTSLQRERESELRKSSGRGQNSQVNQLFDKLELALAAKDRAEESARERERNASEFMRKEKQSREREQRERERNASAVLKDRIQRGNRSNASLLDARSAAGFSALRSSTNQTDRQSVMLAISKEQKALQQRAADSLDNIDEKLAGNEVSVFSLN